MKVLFIFIAFAISANANSLQCTDFSKTDYAVVLSDDQKTAWVSKDGQALQFGQLKCNVSEVALANGPFLSCKTPNVRDAGFKATFSYVNRSLLKQVKLEKSFFGGLLALANLPCIPQGEPPSNF